MATKNSPSGTVASVQALAGSRLRATGILAETFPRNSWSSNQSLLASQRQSFIGIWLDKGTPVTNIGFVSGTTPAGTPTNQWFSLYSAAGVKLRVTSDDLTTAWAANTAKVLACSSPYTVPESAMYYLGIMVKATTVPTVQGKLVSSIIAAMPPMFLAHDTTNVTLTNPASAPDPLPALTASGLLAYGYVT